MPLAQDVETSRMVGGPNTPCAGAQLHGLRLLQEARTTGTRDLAGSTEVGEAREEIEANRSAAEDLGALGDAPAVPPVLTATALQSRRLAPWYRLGAQLAAIAGRCTGAGSEGQQLIGGYSQNGAIVPADRAGHELCRWILEEELVPPDRVAHELRSFADAFGIAGAVGQINGVLVSLELMFRRIAVIIEGYVASITPGAREDHRAAGSVVNS